MLHKVQRQDENQLRESLSPGHWPIKDRHSNDQNDEGRQGGWGRGTPWPTARGPGWRMAAAYKWHCHTMDAAFEPRDGAGLLSLNGRLWMLGGCK